MDAAAREEQASAEDGEAEYALRLQPACGEALRQMHAHSEARRRLWEITRLQPACGEALRRVGADERPEAYLHAHREMEGDGGR